ncbi:NnrS family protein [Methylomicrobium lacus]|uniref:NnrS family protein n=1 Tax=Methylomicrobium lacus TaxID=136992 RepID=UPI00045EBC3B|nr:NnrS family protein [Methylomicrobium lacus]
MTTPKLFDYPLFALGFRAFFVLAGLSALLLIVLWNAIYNGKLSAANYFGNVNWHAHEMLLGYSAAVIAGFLLTAVKNWTSSRLTPTGDQLATLSLIWLYGRIAPFYAGLLPDAVIAAIDFAFLPALAYQIAKPILATRQYVNLIFVGILLVLTAANGLIHAGILTSLPHLTWLGLQLAVATIVLLILVIAGRVFPFFTERGLPGIRVNSQPLYEYGAIGSAVLVYGLLLAGVSGTLLALASSLAVLFNFARIWGWYVQRVWYVPLLWVLYAGYGWIILGFGLTALSAYGKVLPSLPLHAFTVGGIGVLTLGMMARVSLGHTGRALRVSNAMAIGFILLNAGALIRVVLPIALPDWYGTLVYASMLFWLAAFALFVYVYSPILTAPRVDGQAG